MDAHTPAYIETPPSQRLEKIVECYWKLEFADGANAPTESIFPDGCTELIFNLADPFRRFHANGEIEIQPKILLVGQMKEHAAIQPTGRVRLFGVRFKPGGLFPILQTPISEVTNQIIDSKIILGRFSAELEEQLHACETFNECIRLTESCLLARLRFNSAPDAIIDTLAERIIQTGGRVSIEALTRDIGLSHRQIERSFRKRVGISPKLFARIIRFQTVFNALDHGSVNWSQIALGCGYYDQAHLIRDFKTFSGASPGAFLTSQVELTAFFMRKNRTSFFYNT